MLLWVRVSPSAPANLFTSVTLHLYLPQSGICWLTGSPADLQLIDSCSLLFSLQYRLFSVSSSLSASPFYCVFCLHSSGIHWSRKRHNCFCRKNSSFPFEPSCPSFLFLCCLYARSSCSLFCFSLNTKLSLLCCCQAFVCSSTERVTKSVFRYVNWNHVHSLIVWTSDQSICPCPPSLGSDGAEKGAGCSTEPNWACPCEQEETGIQMGHERSRWVGAALYQKLCCLTQVGVSTDKLLSSSSRLDWLLHHFWDLHGQDGRAREGHVRLFQHPQWDHHDDGFHDHVVSVLLFGCVSLQACNMCFCFCSCGPTAALLWHSADNTTERSVTVMDKAKTVYVREIVGRSNVRVEEKGRGKRRKCVSEGHRQMEREGEHERGFPWHMLEFVVWGVAGAGARNNVVGSQGSHGGKSPKCNGSTDGRGATWQQKRKQMRAGGTAERRETIVRACLQRAWGFAGRPATHTEKESVVALKAGSWREGKGREGGSRVGGWKTNSRMLVLQLS